MPRRVETIFSIKNEKNAKRYTEIKICESSNDSVTATISTSICSVNIELDFRASGLFICRDLTNIWIFHPSRAE